MSAMPCTAMLSPHAPLLNLSMYLTQRSCGSATVAITSSSSLGASVSALYESWETTLLVMACYVRSPIGTMYVHIGSSYPPFMKLKPCHDIVIFIKYIFTLIRQRYIRSSSSRPLIFISSVNQACEGGLTCSFTNKEVIVLEEACPQEICRGQCGQAR